MPYALYRRSCFALYPSLAYRNRLSLGAKLETGSIQFTTCSHHHHCLRNKSRFSFSFCRWHSTQQETGKEQPDPEGERYVCFRAWGYSRTTTEKAFLAFTKKSPFGFAFARFLPCRRQSLVLAPRPSRRSSPLSRSRAQRFRVGLKMILIGNEWRTTVSKRTQREENREKRWTPLRRCALKGSISLVPSSCHNLTNDSTVFSP